MEEEGRPVYTTEDIRHRLESIRNTILRNGQPSFFVEKTTLKIIKELCCSWYFDKKVYVNCLQFEIEGIRHYLGELCDILVSPDNEISVQIKPLLIRPTPPSQITAYKRLKSENRLLKDQMTKQAANTRLESISERFERLEHIREENDQLRRENTELKEKIRALEEMLYVSCSLCNKRMKRGEDHQCNRRASKK